MRRDGDERAEDHLDRLIIRLCWGVDPALSPETYGHSGLLDIVKTYDLLAVNKVVAGSRSVSLVPKAEGA